MPSVPGSLTVKKQLLNTYKPRPLLSLFIRPSSSQVLKMAVRFLHIQEFLMGWPLAYRISYSSVLCGIYVIEAEKLCQFNLPSYYSFL